MRLFCRVIFFFIVSTFCAAQGAAQVRVLLADCDKKSSAEWNFTAERGCIVRSADRTSSKKKVKLSAAKIVIKNGVMHCNGKKITQPLRLTPVAGHITFNNVAYDGDFFIIPHKDDFLCVNQVELEDYITAVLKTESWPGWPLEVNKAFA